MSYIVQDFFEILYADDTAAKQYHAEADKDEATIVSFCNTATLSCE